MKKIKTAVFPVAGLGTRFLPATKSTPKEMLNLLDQPLIQYSVDEALQAGVERFIFVTSSRKQSIISYFDRNYELETRLQEAGKLEQYKNVVHHDIPMHNILFIQQDEPKGLGHAIWCVRNVIGKNEPFYVLLADDVYSCPSASAIQQMGEAYTQQNLSGHVVATEIIEPQYIHQYGCIDIEAQISPQLLKAKNLVEKPKKEDAPSHYAVSGRYILDSSIFEALDKQITGSGGEIQLTDAIVDNMKSNQTDVHACLIEGKRFDCGSKQGFLEATIHYALQSGNYDDVFKKYAQLSSLVK